MRIGLTFDLREDYAREGYNEEELAEFDEIETILAIETALSSLGHATERIGNARSLTEKLVRGKRWDLVFNIAECMHGFGRQSLVPALLDSYGIAYTFSDPLCLAVTLHKATAKRVLRDQGIRTPDFALVEAVSDIENIALPYPLFVKPVAEGTSKGISAASLIETPAQLGVRCARLLARHRQPVLVETYLPGREFTVGILGTASQARALGVMELSVDGGPGPAIYSYDNKKHFDERMSARLATDAQAVAAAELAIAAWNGLGGRDAGRIDLRCDAQGQIHFLETNPLAGLHPRNSDLPLLARMRGMDYLGLIEAILVSAIHRHFGTEHPMGQTQDEALT